MAWTEISQRASTVTVKHMSQLNVIFLKTVILKNNNKNRQQAKATQSERTNMHHLNKTGDAASRNTAIQI